MPSSELSHPCIQVSVQNVYFALFYSFDIEPIGGSKPQISEDSQLKRLLRSQNEVMALVCPAQGHPQPSFRLLSFFLPSYHPSQHYFQRQIGEFIGDSKLSSL